MKKEGNCIYAQMEMIMEDRIVRMLSLMGEEVKGDSSELIRLVSSLFVSCCWNVALEGNEVTVFNIVVEDCRSHLEWMMKNVVKGPKKNETV